jgi:hypothetical protein
VPDCLAHNVPDDDRNDSDLQIERDRGQRVQSTSRERRAGALEGRAKK